ncbi:MAG: PspA/IM30 family protein [Marinifilaceae bacterium]|jgi:phage shock protein A|nr:PspA/IM30 family protein [Marinilabiliaceae bacterium JC040]MCT4600211.1 PspA/IM30 family protein [Marinifilaceae bacterium]
MGIFSRLFKIGQSEAHAVVDKLENPIKMTEQGIRDMKKDLSKTLESLAEVKAMAIRSKRELEQSKSAAQDYENKAILILKKAEDGSLSVEDADRLASEALMKKEQLLETVARNEAEINQFDSNISKLDASVSKLRSNISHYENELKTLKARARVSEATKKINKSLAGVDSDSTIAMLEKMKDKVNQQEAVAEAYGDIADQGKSVDDEIDSVLKDSPNLKASSALEALKAKMKK